MDLITAMIYAHAAAGGVALIAGGVALFVEKGGSVHRKSGKVFYYFMLTSALVSLLIAVFPSHHNPFLFSIGVFSSYLLLSGYASLRYREQAIQLRGDRVMAYGILLVGLAMVLYPTLIMGRVHPVLLVFGAIAAAFGLRDLHHFRNPVSLREKWLKLHLAKMTGGYIASLTAFLVVNQLLPGLWNWFSPLGVGGIFIGYWIRRVSRRPVKVG